MLHFKSPSLLFVSGLFVITSTAAHADLKWTETTSFGDNKAGLSVSTTKWMNKNSRRSVTNTVMGPFRTSTNEITLCNTSQQFLLADDVKLYAETTFDPSSIGIPKIPAMNFMSGMVKPTAPKPAAKKKQGTQEISYSITEVGTEKIAGFDSKHYVMESTIVSTGCAGKGTQKVKMELWQANIELPSPCFQTNVESAAKAASSAAVQSDCEVKTTIKTDAAAVANVFDGLTMRMRFGEGQSQMTKEVMMVSQAPIPDTEFALPTDYKKVSEEELNKTQNDAMMKRILGGIGDFSMGGTLGMGF